MSILNRLTGKNTYKVTFSYTAPVLGFVKPTITTSKHVLSRKSDVPEVIKSYLEREHSLSISDLKILDITK